MPWYARRRDPAFLDRLMSSPGIDSSWPPARAVLGLDTRRDLVLFEWSDEAIELQVTRDGAGLVGQCTILRFRRVREGRYTPH